MNDEAKMRAQIARETAATLAKVDWSAKSPAQALSILYAAAKNYRIAKGDAGTDADMRALRDIMYSAECGVRFDYEYARTD